MVLKVIINSGKAELIHKLEANPDVISGLEIPRNTAKSVNTSAIARFGISHSSNKLVVLLM